MDRSLLATLRRAGYWTAYVTDNPFLGYAPPYGHFRHSVNRFVRTGGQIGGHKKASSVPDHILRHWVHPSYDTPKVRAWRKALAQRPSVRTAVGTDYPQLLHAFLVRHDAHLLKLAA